jgi:hypothetical protein
MPSWFLSFSPKKPAETNHDSQIGKLQTVHGSTHIEGFSPSAVEVLFGFLLPSRKTGSPLTRQYNCSQLLFHACFVGINGLLPR